MADEKTREVDPEFLQLLGLIVIRWSLVENWVNDLFVSMTEGEPGYMYVVTANVSQNSIIGWIRTLIDIKRPPLDLVTEMQEVLTEIDEIRAERNALIHGLWGTEGAPGSVRVQTVRLERTAIVKDEVVTAADLHDLIDRILEVAVRLKAILIRCGAYS